MRIFYCTIIARWARFWYNDINIYSSVINTALANLKENEIGKYVAIDISGNNTSGEILLNEYDIESLLDELSEEYDVVLNVNKNEFINRDGILVTVNLNEKISDESYAITVELEGTKNKKLEYSYKVIKSGEDITIENYDPSIETINLETNSGNIE